MMKKVVFAFLVLLSVISVSAFDLSVFPTERTIKTNESAVFEIELSHNFGSDQLFEVFSSDVTWDLRTINVLRVNPAETFRTNLVIRPLNLNPGAYNLPVYFKRSGTNDIEKKILYVELLSDKPPANDYLPAVRGFAKMDEQVDARKGVTLKLAIENQNRRNLNDVQVKVRSKVINKDYQTSLGPLEKKSLTFKADVDPFTPPQKDVLQMTVIVPGDERAFQFDVAPLSYEIMPFGAIADTLSEEKSFLKTVQRISLFNDANHDLTNVQRVPASFFKRWFVDSIPKGKVEDGELVWEVTLQPKESAELLVTYNYRPLFWVIFIVAVLLLAYYWFRSPIVISKRARAIKTDEHGITEIKVVVEVVNRTHNLLRNVKVLDLLPNLVDVVEDDRFVSPVVSPHHTRGTLLKWTIEAMDPREHRIFMYRAKTRLSILGGFTLPVAAAQFVADKQKRETVSNKPEIRV